MIYLGFARALTNVLASTSGGRRATQTLSTQWRSEFFSWLIWKG